MIKRVIGIGMLVAFVVGLVAIVLAAAESGKEAVFIFVAAIACAAWITAALSLIFDDI